MQKTEDYWGCLLAVNLQIYLETLSLKRTDNIPTLPGGDFVCFPFNKNSTKV